MKILITTWSIYDKRLEEFSTNRTGGGQMIKDIADGLADIDTNEVYLLVASLKSRISKLGKINIIDNQSEIEVNNKFDNIENDKVSHLLAIFEEALIKLNPDIVSVQATGDFSRGCILISKKHHIPCVYTEHLFISPNNIPHGYEKTVEWEKQMAEIPNLNVIAVSTGMKNEILKIFKHFDRDNIFVINNGSYFKKENRDDEITRKYTNANIKNLLCSGTLCNRKNQFQAIRSYSMLPSEIRNKIRIILCGNIRKKDDEYDRIFTFIHNNNLVENVIYAGAMSSEEMKSMYYVSDGLLMPSIAEGLSLAAIESIAYGKPVVMFKDSECAIDLNSEDAVVFAEHHTDESFSNSIIRWYFKVWNEKKILEYSKKFSMNRVISDYMNCFRKIIQHSKDN